MTTLEWRETEEGYESSGYRIKRFGTHEWAIHCDRRELPTATRRGSTDMRVFSSLKSARAAALHMELVRIRRLKLIRHVTLSLVMLCLSVGSYVTMATGTQTNRLEWFVIAGAVLFVGSMLSCFSSQTVGTTATKYQRSRRSTGSFHPRSPRPSGASRYRSDGSTNRNVSGR